MTDRGRIDVLEVGRPDAASGLKIVEMCRNESDRLPRASTLKSVTDERRTVSAPMKIVSVIAIARASQVAFEEQMAA